MTARAEFDVGPLSWVKGEIDHAIQRAHEALRAFGLRPLATDGAVVFAGHFVVSNVCDDGSRRSVMPAQQQFNFGSLPFAQGLDRLGEATQSQAMQN